MSEIRADQQGCWLDSCRGIYLGEAVQDIAESYGWQGERLDVSSEFYHEAIDEAEGFLQQFAPEGFYFGSNKNGDWGLWRSDDNQDSFV